MPPGGSFITRLFGWVGSGNSNRETSPTDSAAAARNGNDGNKVSRIPLREVQSSVDGGESAARVDKPSSAKNNNTNNGNTQRSEHEQSYDSVFSVAKSHAQRSSPRRGNVGVAGASEGPVGEGIPSTRESSGIYPNQNYDKDGGEKSTAAVDTSRLSPNNTNININDPIMMAKGTGVMRFLSPEKDKTSSSGSGTSHQNGRGGGPGKSVLTATLHKQEPHVVELLGKGKRHEEVEEDQINKEEEEPKDKGGDDAAYVDGALFDEEAADDVSFEENAQIQSTDLESEDVLKCGSKRKSYGIEDDAAQPVKKTESSSDAGLQEGAPINDSSKMEYVGLCCFRKMPPSMTSSSTSEIKVRPKEDEQSSHAAVQAGLKRAEAHISTTKVQLEIAKAQCSPRVRIDKYKRSVRDLGGPSTKKRKVIKQEDVGDDQELQTSHNNDNASVDNGGNDQSSTYAILQRAQRSNNDNSNEDQINKEEEDPEDDGEDDAAYVDGALFDEEESTTTITPTNVPRHMTLKSYVTACRIAGIEVPESVYSNGRIRGILRNGSSVSSSNRVHFAKFARNRNIDHNEDQKITNMRTIDTKQYVAGRSKHNLRIPRR